MKAAALTLAFVVMFAASAGAYGYTDCGGAPCHWPNWPVEYWVNENGTEDLSNEFDIVQKSFQRWESENQTFCTIDFNYSGTTNIDTFESDGRNVILWVEQGWEYDVAVLALTQCWYNADSEFYDCDIAINGQNYIWDVDQDGAVNEIDLRSTLTHEIGHLWGLDHSEVRESTMYWAYDTRSNAADLDYDDIAGAHADFCSEDLEPDDPYEQNDSRVHAESWGDGMTLEDLRLYDDDWFRLRVPENHRVKVEILDEDPARFKNIYLYDGNGVALDVQPCDGDCAVALGSPGAEEVSNVVVRGEFDENMIQAEAYSIRVSMVLPGQEGELYDDDDDGGEGAVCGCDPLGAGSRVAAGPAMGWAFALFALTVAIRSRRSAGGKR
jgi:Matrixin